MKSTFSFSSILIASLLSTPSHAALRGSNNEGISPLVLPTSSLVDGQHRNLRSGKGPKSSKNPNVKVGAGEVTANTNTVAGCGVVCKIVDGAQADCSGTPCGGGRELISSKSPESNNGGDTTAACGVVCKIVGGELVDCTGTACGSHDGALLAKRHLITPPPNQSASDEENGERNGESCGVVCKIDHDGQQVDCTGTPCGGNRRALSASAPTKNNGGSTGEQCGVVCEIVDGEEMCTGSSCGDQDPSALSTSASTKNDEGTGTVEQCGVVCKVVDGKQQCTGSHCGGDRRALSTSASTKNNGGGDDGVQCGVICKIEDGQPADCTGTPCGEHDRRALSASAATKSNEQSGDNDGEPCGVVCKIVEGEQVDCTGTACGSHDRALLSMRHLINPVSHPSPSQSASNEGTGGDSQSCGVVCKVSGGQQVDCTGPPCGN